MAEGTAISPGPLPKHTQVRERIISLAVPGEAIPSERELMAAWGVSRATVRKAIDGLVADGLLQRTHGLGTFAVRPRVETRLHLASFTQDMRRRGLDPATQVGSAGLAAAPEAVAAALGIEVGTPTWHLVRTRLADGLPMAVEEGWYPAESLPGLADRDLTGSLYQVLGEGYGLQIDRAEQVLWGEVATPALAAALQAPVSTALLVFRRTSYAGARPVEYVVSHYRGDRYQVHMDLSSSMPAEPINDHA